MCLFRANSLQQSINEWKNIGANDYVIKCLTEGVKLPFINEPEKFVLDNYDYKIDHVNFIDVELEELLEKGCVSKVDYTPHCVSPISCVDKKNNKLCLITDLRKLNSSCKVHSFINEDINNVKNIVQPDDNLITIDIRKGFFHIPVHENYRKYLGFAWRKQCYVWNVTPFGFNGSSYFFNKVLRCVVRYF